MKVGVITIYRKNYGAFLQAYGLQQALIKLGHRPELIRYDYYKDHNWCGVSLVSNPTIITLIKATIVEIVRFIPHRKRLKVFDASVCRNLFESKEYYKTYPELEANPPEYDVYITGSDQVFNPNLTPQTSPARRLDFVRKGIKASYAASAGSSVIDNHYRDKFINALSSYKGISVREEGLAKFIESDYGLKAEVHIDPVFILNKAEWANFSEPIENLKGNYIFYYRVLPQKELNETARILSEKTGLPVYVADGHDTFDNQIKRKGFLSPEQWVYAINNASYVVTNSFHGSAFAINLRKTACILVPPKGGERVSNLLKNSGMEKMINDPFFIYNSSMFDYGTSEAYFDRERKRSLSYLAGICTYKE